MSTTPHPGYGATPAYANPLPPGQQPAPKPKRPWFKKKRFLIPIGLLLVFWLIGAVAGDPAEPGAAAPAASEVVQDDAAAEEKSAEEIAAEEAEAAEAARIEQEQEAAAAEAERIREEQEAAAAAEAERVRQEEAAAAAAAAAAAEAAKGTVSQQNAYESAQSYLGHSAFSRAGLAQQLTSEFGEGYPAADAEFAIARLEAEGGVDWNAEAAESAQSYLSHSSFSRSGLIQQLTSEFGEGFTQEQAEYGVSTTGL